VTFIPAETVEDIYAFMPRHLPQPYFLSVGSSVRDTWIVAQSGLPQVHFAESSGELHHLLISMKLGDRIALLAQHSAFLLLDGCCFVCNPQSQSTVEQEAYDTYNTFWSCWYLKATAKSLYAVKYYTSNDMYMFDAMHFGSSTAGSTDDETSKTPSVQT
jgi:hypothetical protein